MQRLVLTLDTPAENLALDEALLDLAESAGAAAEYLRWWESPRPMVVLGRSSRVEEEVDQSACAARGIPILRRTSGGATIVAGPGCLMYAVVLSHERRPASRGIHEAHRYVLERMAAALATIVPTATSAGTSDLAFLGADGKLRKFSGNSMRAKRTHVLYHGTLLYDYDLQLVGECLRTPPRQPEYRAGRSHNDFIANLPVPRATIEAALQVAWPTSGTLSEYPRTCVEQLVVERYSQEEWNLGYGRSISR